MSNYVPYRWCVVSECENTSVKTPDKLWIQVPVDINMRNTWLKVARRDPGLLSNKSRLYFCEDHFDLEHDMENYIKYKIMGSVKRIKMKPNCIPSRFAWNRKHKILKESHPTEAKRQRVALPEDSYHDYKEAENNEVSSYTEAVDMDVADTSGNGDVPVNTAPDFEDQESSSTDMNKDSQYVNIMDEIIDIKEEPLEAYPSSTRTGKETIITTVINVEKRDSSEITIMDERDSSQIKEMNTFHNCKEELQSQTLLQKHHENDNKKSTRQCDICLIKFKSRQVMMNHIKTHTDRQKFVCNECEKPFAAKASLKQHIEKIHNQTHRHKCHVCGDRFENSNLAMAHMKSHTEYKCNKCDESFSDSAMFDDHKVTCRLQNKPYKCKLCDKRYNKSACLQKHVKAHSEKKANSHKCPVCLKECYKAHKLKIHSRIHTGEKPFKCNVCDKAFSRLDTLLNSHMPTHTGEKPHECDVCKKKFVTSTKLAYHKRTHSGVKPYECKLCKKRFTVSAEVGRHLKNYHRRNLMFKMFKCDSCDESFALKKTLKSHIKKKHG